MAKNKLFEKSFKENLLKNLLIIILVSLFYNSIYSSLQSLKVEGGVNDFLLIVSMLLVTVCFANFAFSYEYSNLERLGMRLLAHLATFIFMLLIALLLESLVIVMRVIYPSLLTISIIFSILLYLGVALYDFWDFMRAFRE